jgi:hypothetical protein
VNPLARKSGSGIFVFREVGTEEEIRNSELRQDTRVEILRRVRRREALGEQARLRMTGSFVGR